MTTLNFPDSPAPNAVYTLGSRSWTWNGNAWQLVSQTISGSVGYTGSAGTGGSSYSRSTASTANVLANAAVATTSITGFKGYNLYQIQTSAASWVRIYSNAASQTADASRSSGTDPAADAGVIAEVITTGSQTVSFTPAVVGYNNETVPTTAIPVTFNNLSGSSATVTVTLTLLQTEA